jgi:hypothetical protein
VKGKNVGVVEARNRLDLVQEPLGTQCGRELGMQDLEGDPAVRSSARNTTAIPPRPISDSTA